MQFFFNVTNNSGFPIYVILAWGEDRKVAEAAQWVCTKIGKPLPAEPLF